MPTKFTKRRLNIFSQETQTNTHSNVLYCCEASNSKRYTAKQLIKSRKSIEHLLSKSFSKYRYIEFAFRKWVEQFNLNMCTVFQVSMVPYQSHLEWSGQYCKKIVRNKSTKHKLCAVELFKISSKIFYTNECIAMDDRIYYIRLNWIHWNFFLLKIDCLNNTFWSENRSIKIKYRIMIDRCKYLSWLYRSKFI